MARPRSVSIAQMGGLKKYLDDTKSLHNGLDYSVFELCIKKRISRNACSRLFSVNDRTILKWRNVYHEEQIDERQRSN